MKKTLLIAFSVFIARFGFAQTAVDFTATDCNSTSHTLFTELNAGKVIVITWVMPCNACIAGASTASSTVQNMGNPNVVFYLVDDYGNSTCSTLNSWKTTYSITANAVFDNSGNVIKMADYGPTGMPKTIVLGGNTCHSVFFNYNGTPSSSALQTAINNALTPCTGVIENNAVSMGLNVFPNPVSSTATVNYTLTKSTVVTVEVMNELGEKINVISLGNQSAGKQEYKFNLESLSAGVYFVKLSAGEASETIKLTVTK